MVDKGYKSISAYVTIHGKDNNVLYTEMDFIHFAQKFSFRLLKIFHMRYLISMKFPPPLFLLPSPVFL